MPTEPAKNFRRLSFAVPSGFNVDRQAGTLKNLCLIEGGREAKGHGLYVDDETIRTAHECATKRRQLKGAIRHLSWDEYFSKGADRVLDFPGWFSGFSVKGAQLVAEKFEFYESFRTDPEQGKAFARIMEIAEKTPDVIGLSIEAWGYAVFVAKDGKEYGTKPDGVELQYDGIPALRITDLFFAAFVDEPAATEGLFAKFAAAAPSLAALFGGKQSAERTALIAHLERLVAGTVPLPAPSIVPPSPTPESTDFSTMKIIAALKAKFTDPQRFAAAMSIVGNTPEAELANLTVGAVEQQLVAVDLAAAQADVKRLQTELAAEQKKVVDLTKERDDAKSALAKFKTSGHGGVALGAGEGAPGAAADEPNPWVRGAHFNRTRQAELTKADPTRAAALKAAAQETNAAAKK